MVTFSSLRWPWGGNRFTTIPEVQAHLGNDHVYESSRILPAWGNKTLACDTPVLYPLHIIRQCAKENTQKKDRRNWRLVYGVGFSLKQMFAIRGTDPRAQPVFCEGSTLWQAQTEDSWTAKPFVSGYYLINFAVLFKNATSKSQDLKVSELGEVYSSVPAQILAEALFSIYMLTGERFLERELHCPPTTDSYGCRVKMGYFDSNGLSIGSFDYRRKDSGILTYIKPHVPTMESSPQRPA